MRERVGQSGVAAIAFAITILVLGGVVDATIVGPFFKMLTAGTPTTGWNPSTVFLFFNVIPYAFSAAMVSAVIGVIFGRR